MGEKKIFDVWKTREDFPLLKTTMNGHPLTYLDTAATAQKPAIVVDAMSRFYQERYGTVHRSVYELAAYSTQSYSVVREKVKEFIGAKEEEEIVFTKGTTDSINLVASSYGRLFLQEGDEIIISEMEHHSNIIPWQLLCKEKKCLLKVIPITAEGEIIFTEYENLLSSKTKLVCVAHISNVLGTINPIKKIVEKAHEYGAKVLVDGAQAAAHLIVDVKDLDVDFYAFSAHKMYGPTGVGVLFGKKELLEKMPPVSGGGDMVETVTFESATFQPSPLKFEAGTPNIAGVIGLGVAIDYLNSLGRETVIEWEQKLLKESMKKILEVENVKIAGTAEDKAGVISFCVEGVHPLDLGTILGLKGIAVRTGHLCAEPLLNSLGHESLSRVSFGLYSTPEDFDVFLQSLKEAISLLSPIASY